MSAAQIRPGFTLLEMLAACVLLGLLVTLLLSLFNQGEIAWSVGKSTATATGRQERSLARAAREGAETVFVTKPTSAAVRLLQAWEANGDIRTTRPCSGRHGKTVSVEGSGCRNKSERASSPNPLTAEASKAMPVENARSISSGMIEMFFCAPYTSQKARRMNFTSSCSTYSKTSSAEYSILLPFSYKKEDIRPLGTSGTQFRKRPCSRENYTSFSRFCQSPAIV